MRFFFCVLLLAALSGRAALAEAVRSDVKIGVIIPLSGDMAVHGSEIRRAMELAMKNLNRTVYDYRLIFEDNRLEANASIGAAKKLIDVDKSDVIVTLWPPTARVVIPLTEKADVLHYTISWDPDLAKSAKLVLSHQVMVNAVVGSTLQLLRDKNAERVAFLHMEEAGFNLGAKHFTQLADSFGVHLVANEAFDGSATDFRALLDRVKRADPQYYVIWSVAPSLDLVVRQLKERKADAAITGYLDYAQDLSGIQGAEYVSEMYSSDDFQKAYEKEYHQAPVSKGANAYDILNVLVDAYERFPQKKPAAAELKAVLLETKNFPGAVGVFSIDTDGNSSYSPVRRRIEEANRVLIGGAR